MKALKLASLVLLLSVPLFETNSGAQSLSQTVKARIDVQQGAINDMAFSTDGRHLAIASTKSLQLYDAKTYKELISFTGHTDSVLAVALSPDGKLLISGGQDETVRAVENRHRGTRSHPREHWGHVNALAFSPDGEMFWSGCNNDREIRSWFRMTAARTTKGKIPSHI